MKNTFSRRFAELDAAHGNFAYQTGGMTGRFVRSGEWEGWATSAENLIRAVYGEAAPHYICSR
jgi:hypothetical protein